MDSVSDVSSSVYTDSALKHAIEVSDARNSAEGQDRTSSPNDRTVRSSSERQCLDAAAQVLAQMRPLAINSQNLGRTVRKQSRVYNEMSKMMTQTHSAVAVYAAEAQFLVDEQHKLETQQGTLQAFMDRVYVSLAEKDVLTDAESSLSPEFLAAFTKVRQIHMVTAPVMSSEAPRAGESSMLETSQLSDSAYMKVKRAIELELKRKSSGTPGSAPGTSTISAGSSEEGGSALRQYMMLLADRPSSFKSVLENQSGSRRTRLNREFALFLAKEQGSAAYMPVRFLGNVLAWIHAAVVNELEHISLLLDPGEPQAETPQNRLISSLLSTSNPHQIVAELVDQVVGSLEPSLRQHSNSSILAQTDAALVDEMQSVLLFYQQTVLSRYEQPKSDALFTQSSDNLSSQFTRLLPREWNARVDLASQSLRTYDQGVYVNAEFFSKRSDEVLDSALKEELSYARTDDNEIDPIASLNISDTAVSQLAGYVVAQPKLDYFQKLEDEFVAKQVAKEVNLMKEQSQLNLYQVNAISSREFMTQVDTFLINAGQESVIRLDRLSSPSTAHRIANMAVDEFVGQYEFATRETNARPSEEVRSLLS